MKELRVKLVASDTSGTYDAGELILKNLDSTTIDKADDFISSFKLPKTKLTEAQLSNLKSDSYTAKIEFTNYYEDGKSTKTQENKIISKSNMLSMESNYLTDNTSDYRLFGKGEDGKVHQYGIDAQNKEVDESRDQSWDNLASLTSSFSDYGAFLSDDGENFKYYGALGEYLAYSFTYAEIADPTNLTLTVKDGKVSTVEITYPSATDSEGKTYIEKALVTLTEASDISIPTPYKENSDTPKIKAAFDSFLNDPYIFVEKKDGEDAYATKVFSTKDTLYYETLYSLAKGDDDISNVQIDSAHGYHRVSSSQVEAFKIDEKGNAQGNKVVDNLNPSSFSNFSFSPLAFELKDGYIVPKPHILNIPQFFFNGIYFQGSIVSPTMKMKFDEKTQKITSISYQCQPNETVYNMTLDFTWDNVSLPKYLNDMKGYKPFVAPGTWLDETEGIKDKMIEMFGEEKAKSFPYLFSNDLKGKWTYSTSSPIKGHEVLNLSVWKRGFDNASFIEEYIKLLDGYKVSQGSDSNNDHDYNIYENDELKIGVAIRTDYKDDSYVNLYFFSL